MDTKKLNGIWRCMRYRCHSKSPNNHYAPYYRDKGIMVCAEWKSSFEAFKEWALANGYRPGLSIDRIDPDGNYEPKNCRWVTVSENARHVSTRKPDPTRRKSGKYSVVYVIAPNLQMVISEKMLYRDAKKLVGKLEKTKPSKPGTWYNIYPPHGLTGR